MILRIVREPTQHEATLGVLFINNAFHAFTLEDAIRAEKIAGRTCIPPGRYAVRLSWSPKFQRILPEVLDVPNFTGIRLHPGNTVADTDGCILVGLQRTALTVLNSRQAHAALQTMLTTAQDMREPVTLVIENPDPQYQES